MVNTMTKIDLCSMALLKLGEQPIETLDSDTPSAKLGKTLVDFVIDNLLSAHPWNFACGIRELVKNQDGVFEIPSDILRIVKVHGKVSKNKIIADGNKISVLAISRVDVESFPSYFVSLVTTKLAMEFCMPLLSDQTVFRTMAALYETELQTAKFIDSTMNSGTGIESFSLIDARF